MGDLLKFVPPSERRGGEKPVKFRPIAEMYQELDRLRRSSGGKAPVAGIAMDGEVAIDQDFKPLNGIVHFPAILGGRGVVDTIGRIEEPDINKVYHGGLNEKSEWHRQLVGVDKLLHFDFGKVRIVLEGSPTYQVRDYKNNDRGHFRHLALNDYEANNPSYIFSVSEDGGESYRVQVSSDGTIKILSPHLEDTYKDKLTGETTLKPKGLTEKKVAKEVPVFAEVPMGLKELLTRTPIKQLLQGRRTVRKEAGKETREVIEREEHDNEFIGGPNTEIKLDKDRPAKYDLALFLTNLLKGGLKSLQAAEKGGGKIPSI